jgi:16S rRNA (uracil1498-N3)-methyltransferase
MIPTESTSEPRFHCPAIGDPGSAAMLEAEQARHAARVLRLREGDGVELFDGCGRVARGVIVTARRDAVAVQVVSAARIEPDTPAVDMAVALPKGPRVEDMVNQLAQVGVDRLVPLRAARATVEPRDAKLDRLRRVAMDAARQSRRAWAMTIDEPATLTSVLSGSHDLRLIAQPGATASPHRLTAAGLSRVLVLIGPEGGWTDQELAATATAGCLPWRLGPHVMRIETAAVVAAALMRYLTMPPQ